MAIEINRELLETQLDDMDLHRIMLSLDIVYKNEVDYINAYSNPLNSAKEKKICKQRIVFFRGMRLVIEDYLVKTFAVDAPDATTSEEAVASEQ